MRNKTLLAFAIASCISAPLAFAQGRGAGGPPAGAGAIGNAASRVADRVSDRASSGIDTASRAAMQRTTDHAARTQFGAEQKTTVQSTQNQTAIDARLKADAKAEAKATDRDDVDGDDVDGGTLNANASFGQDTAARAKLQGEADVETRKTFGSTQSAAAKAKVKADVTGDDATDADDSTDGDDDGGE